MMCGPHMYTTRLELFLTSNFVSIDLILFASLQRYFYSISFRKTQIC